MEGAMLAAVDAANVIAATHRDTRVAASVMVASAVDALGISGGDDPDREVRARGDVATIISELVRAGADVNAPARLARPRVDDLVTDLAYPLTLAVGLFADGVNPEAHKVVWQLLDAGADVNVAGIGPYPLVCPPLFAAALAIRRNVEESVDVFERILASGANPSARAVFPEGSECSPLVELLHVLREGRIWREGVLGLIETLLDAGADPKTPLPEVYCLGPHPACAAADPVDRAAPGEYLELRRAVARTVASIAADGSLVADAAERAATGSAATGEARSRVRATKKIVRRRRVRLHVRIPTVRPPHPSPPSLARVSPPRGFAWVVASTRPSFGRSRRRAATGSTRRRAVEMISARLDHDVDAAQGLNHHSWTEGSLTAMAVAAAIEAAGPAPDPNREVTPSERERGAVERDPRRDRGRD